MKNSFRISILVIGLFFVFSLMIPANAQDIAQLMAEKHTIHFEEQSFDVYYGFKGSLEVEISVHESERPIISEMSLNQEKKSLEITIEESEYAGPMWVRLPPELITAEGGNFQLLIDDKEKPFELTYYTNDLSVGFFLPEGSQKMEIIGTSVIPEFSGIAVLVLIVGIFSVIFFSRKVRLELQV